jgi:adenylate cyclase
MSSVRRLAAILAADVAGYSRLMEADEEGTHERLKAHLGELVNPKIKEHRGRTVKNTGDGMLVEFPSVVDAVRCAVEIQRGMLDREPEVPDEQRIRFRDFACHGKSKRKFGCIIHILHFCCVQLGFVNNAQ